MNTQITLSKKFGMAKRGHTGYEYLYGNGYLTNGNFMIAIPFVKNAADYIHNPLGKRDDGVLSRVVPDLSKCRKWEKTQFAYCILGRTVIIYKSDITFVSFCEDYVKLLDLGELYGTETTSAFCNFEQTIIIMPMRSPNLEEKIKELSAFSALV